MRKLETMRTNLRPGDVTIEGVFAEASALLSIGAMADAVSRLDRTLDGIRFVSVIELGQIPQTGVLLRAIILRARLAERMGETATAKLWANAAVVLALRSDDFLADDLRDMERLSR